MTFSIICVSGSPSRWARSVPGKQPELFLAQNAPNPFRRSTEIVFTVPAARPITLGIYDLSGRLVRTLLDEEAREVGERRMRWDGIGANGQPLAAGIYLCRLTVGVQILERKLHLLR